MTPDPRAGWIVAFIMEMDRELDAYARQLTQRIIARGQPVEWYLDDLVMKITEAA